MKLLVSAAGLLCAALLAIVAAPALSLSPWEPEPVNFERAAPRADVAPGRAVLSPPVRAPKRFNLVGLTWRGRVEPGLLVRSRKAGGRWSRWAPVSTHADDAPDPGRGEPAGGASAPVWAGEADDVQYRLSRPVPGLRLQFVNVDGTATPADRVRSAVRGAANAAVGSLAAALSADDAGAEEPRPRIVRRASWGAERCPPRRSPSYGRVKAAVVHHTVSLNDYTREEAPDIVLAICRYHRNSRGWDDIGYNFLVDKYGTLYEGRAGGIHRAVVGAQAQGYNSQTTGISNIGDHSRVPQSSAALRAMARLIRWKLPLHFAPTYGSTTLVSAGGSSNRYPTGTRVRVRRVIGHRDTGSTACPGQALYDQLGYLRRLVGRVDPSGIATAVRVRLSRRSVRYAGAVRMRGRLTRAGGVALVGETVRVQVRRARRWRTVRETTTAEDGRFTLRFRLRRTRLVRARFSGRGDLRASSSRRTLVRVRPRITLIRPPARGTAGSPVRLRGRVLPYKRRLRQVVQRRRGGRFVTLTRRTVRVRRGRFRSSFTPRTRGVYRVYLAARADRATASGRSRALVVPIGRSATGAPRAG